jgi:hypothetical protein
MAILHNVLCFEAQWNLATLHREKPEIVRRKRYGVQENETNFAQTVSSVVIPRIRRSGYQ